MISRSLWAVSMLCCGFIYCSSFTLLVDARTATVEALSVLHSALHVVQVGVLAFNICLCTPLYVVLSVQMHGVNIWQMHVMYASYSFNAVHRLVPVAALCNVFLFYCHEHHYNEDVVLIFVTVLCSIVNPAATFPLTDFFTVKYCLFLVQCK